ncbi:glycosyltransferase family 2 protein [Vibrio breoganii]
MEKSNKPLVSIIVPMFKVESYVYDCIKSLVNQTYQNIEVILVNDGSPDGSADIASKFSEIDRRVKLINSVNRGVSSARNLGIKAAIGKYIVFVDGDDLLNRFFVERFTAVIEKTDADFVISTVCEKFIGNPSDINHADTRLESTNRPVWSSDKAAAELMYPGCIDLGCWNKMYKRDFLLDKRLTFSEDLFMGEGLHFIIKCAFYSNRVVALDERLYYYRKDNLSSATTVINVPKYINALESIDRLSIMKSKFGKEFNKAFDHHLYLANFYLLNAIVRTGTRNTYATEFDKSRHFLIRNMKVIYNLRKSFKSKVLITITIMFPKIIYFLNSK